MDVHFVDGGTGQCVSTLSVNRADLTNAQIVADLTANKPAAVSLAFPAQGHVCAAPPANPLAPKIARLAVLRAKGWGNLTAAEQAEANALKFDLGL